ncbi:hypothetical protein [Lelliottia nimipressuralis]|uniref:DUF805 domain-containing protein n=1 Tax=Lelliottia nimipressuralis TaxID=69220 RepID=A0ABY3NXA6_9ENTR|nr:hypothetical protein [Lelliottia nimipressuralis]RXJ10748.1 hypothetical protein ETG88_19600 [Lelliottia nimipressuralis]TYT29250.1 hypothetical protein FZO59_20885 [Lelliottia nimipressuralis]
MAITNHDLLGFRVISLLVAAVFSAVVYVDIHAYFMFPLFLLQLVVLVLALVLKRRRKEKSLVIIGKGGFIAIVFIYICAVALGITMSLTTSRTMDAIFLLLFYVVCLDAIMAIPFVLSFTDKSKWQHGGPVSRSGSGSEINHVNGHMAAAYADSDYNLMSNEMCWPQSDCHANSITDSPPGVNPASGLPMANDAIDVGGNVYGFGDTSFVNYDHHTNQFSDFDYHNNS